MAIRIIIECDNVNEAVKIANAFSHLIENGNVSEVDFMLNRSPQIVPKSGLPPMKGGWGK